MDELYHECRYGDLRKLELHRWKTPYRGKIDEFGMTVLPVKPEPPTYFENWTCRICNHRTMKRMSLMVLEVPQSNAITQHTDPDKWPSGDHSERCSVGSLSAIRKDQKAD